MENNTTKIADNATLRLIAGGQGVPSDEKFIEMISSTRLHLDDIPADPQPLICIGDLPVCTRENFSVVVGLAGSRKTFLCTAIAGAFLNQDGFMGFENPNNVGKLLWIDTEQAGGHVGRIGRRLNKILKRPTDEDSDSIIIHLLREYSPPERRDFFLKAIEYYKPDFVVLDGLADLINDPNNPDDSCMLVTDLMRLTAEYGCHILTVVHCNVGSEKARGHLGSEAMRKAETVITVTADDGYSVCKFAKTRDMRPNDFGFMVNNDLPELVVYQPKINQRTDKLKQIIDDIMPELPATISYGELRRKMNEYSNVSSRTSEKRIHQATDFGFIIKNNVGMYHLPTNNISDNVVPF